MSIFDKAICNEFMNELESLAAQGGWWADVLADKSLLIALRGKHLNVYWQGQSLFKVWHSKDKVVASTHPKYLIDPGLSNQVQFNGNEFSVSKIIDGGIVRSYGSGTLSKMKRAAEIYADDEKRGVHAIATRNSNVVDVEVVFSATEGADTGKLPRVDIATFERDGDRVRLVFWEAKLFWNKELRANGLKFPLVLNQVEKYRTELSAQRETVVDSYRRAARNLVRLSRMSQGARPLDEAVRAVASGDAELTLATRPDGRPDVGVLIYGYSAAERDDEGWRTHLRKIEDDVGRARVRSAGDAKHIRL